MSGGDLRAVWCLSAWRKLVAQPGERIRVRALSGAHSRNSEYSGRRGRFALDRDAWRGSGAWAERESREPVHAVPFGQARKFRDGSDVTLVAWGNTVEKSLEALGKINNEVSIELFDLRSIVPWDKDAIAASVHKTGRLVVVQEDTESCSVGQMIISHITAQPDLWSEMVSPPILVSKANVMIGYNPIYEYAALPDVERIVAAIRKSVSIQTSRAESPILRDRKPAAIESAKATPKKVEMPKGHVQKITVPIMGEGIRNAKIVSLLKKPRRRHRPGTWNDLNRRSFDRRCNSSRCQTCR